MNEMIKIFDIESYPAHLVRLIDQQRDLFIDYYEKDRHTSNKLPPVAWWLQENYKTHSKYQKLQRDVYDQLNGCWIEGFHITRAFPDGDFLKKYYWKQGLRLPDRVFTKEYIADILSRIDGSPNEKASFREYFKNRYQDDTGHDDADLSFSSRKETISIFSANSNFALYDFSDNMSFLYGKNVLGEINRDHMDTIKKSTLYQSLIQRTCPHIIQLRFRITETMNGSSEYSRDFVLNQLIGILASKHFLLDSWGINKDNSIFFAHLKSEIPPEQILSIEKLPQGTL